MRKERNDFFDTRTYTVIIMDSDREHTLNLQDYRRIEAAISLMKEEYPRGIDSRTVAGHTGLSEFHFRRLFRRWAGIPPERFIRYLAKEHALTLIRESASYLESALEAGFSGPGRFADACLSLQAKGVLQTWHFWRENCWNIPWEPSAAVLSGRITGKTGKWRRGFFSVYSVNPAGGIRCSICGAQIFR